MRKQVKLPSILADFDGSRRERGTIWMESAGKPPKLRFQPSCFVEYEGELHEIIYAYRLAENPNEWLYCLEKRNGLSYNDLRQDDLAGNAILAAGAGGETPRIVYDLFTSITDTLTFFADIVCQADRRVIKSGDLLRKGRRISSGEVVTK